MWKSFFREIKESAQDSRWNGFYAIALLVAYLSAPAFVEEESMPFVCSALLTASCIWMTFRVVLAKKLANRSAELKSVLKWRISTLPMIALLGGATTALAGFAGASLEEIYRTWTGIFLFGGYLMFGELKSWGKSAEDVISTFDAKSKACEEKDVLMEKAALGQETPPRRRRSGL